jgi:hypothetical protein
MTAIIHVPTAVEDYFEREISATFENGGELEITVRGESLGGVLEILLNTVAAVKLNRDRTLDLSLRYWHLTEDFETVEVKAFATIVEDYSTDQCRLVRRLAANARSRFLKKLARHHIALRGEKGEL